MGASRFRDELWEAASESVIPAILKHPFITGLVGPDASLEEDVFKRYIVQDHKYLFAYGSVLNTLAARAPTRELASFFTSSAANILGTEVTLHVGLLEKWGLSEADVEAAPMQPACLMYTSYLQNICNTRPFFEGLAAVLPCYWVYQHVGQHLKRQGSGRPKYQAWIDMYGGEEFDAIVQQALGHMDAVAEGLTTAQRQACVEHFVAAARMEYMFWDGPYRGEAWPC